MWYMLPNPLWNSHILLYDHEISHVHTRHLELCIGVDPIHFSSVFILLWFFEVDPWMFDFFVYAWNCFDFLILIDHLPMIQLSWNFICMPCYVLGVIMIYLVIFGNVWVDFWCKSFCWLLWAFICHVLTSFAYELMMMHDMNLKPIGFAS